MRIQGSGKESLFAGVTEKGLNVDAVTNSAQHVISHQDSNAYQVEGEIAVAITEKTVLTLKNNHASKKTVITFIRLQSIGVAAAGVDAYFNIKSSGEWSSGGTEVTSVNMKMGSPKTASVECYEGSGTDIVMSGSPVQFDRNYQANSMESYGKEGTVILDSGASMSITFKGSTAAGKAYARISFYME